MASSGNVKVIVKDSSGRKVASLTIKRSWAPRNYDVIVNSLPIRTRVYCSGGMLQFTLLGVRLEKVVDSAKKGDVIVIPSMNAVAIMLGDVRNLRYKATLIGRVDEGIDELACLCPAASVQLVRE